MLLRCRCLTKSPPAWCAFASGVLLRMSGIQIMPQIWHPTQRQVSVLQNNLGSNLGVHFRAPVLGSRFWVQFWDPVLDQIWDQKTSIVGPTFGTKSGSIFGVQILVSLILLIRAGFQVPVLGPKKDPLLEPNKSEKRTRSGTQKWDPIWSYKHKSRSGTQIRDQIWHPKRDPYLAPNYGTWSGSCCLWSCLSPAATVFGSWLTLWSLSLWIKTHSCI